MKGSKKLIVIPCSRRKQHGGETNLRWRPEESAATGLSERSSAFLLESRRQLAEQFGYVEGEDLGGRAPALVPLMPAHTRYDGNLYRKIDKSIWRALSGADGIELVIVSALYGLVAPGEAIREYDRAMTERMNTRMRLGRWWSQRGLGSLLVEYTERSEASVVHDFLSGAYVEIGDKLSCLGVGVRVERHKFPGLRSAADYYRGQKVRGLLTAHLPDVSFPRV